MLRGLRKKRVRGASHERHLLRGEGVVEDGPAAVWAGVVITAPGPSWAGRTSMTIIFRVRSRNGVRCGRRERRTTSKCANSLLLDLKSVDKLVAASPVIGRLAAARSRRKKVTVAYVLNTLLASRERLMTPTSAARPPRCRPCTRPPPPSPASAPPRPPRRCAPRGPRGPTWTGA